MLSRHVCRRTHGDGKTLDQKSDIVFWYKRKDGVHRAIYGDLSVQDIAADKLPNK